MNRDLKPWERAYAEWDWEERSDTLRRNTPTGIAEGAFAAGWEAGVAAAVQQVTHVSDAVSGQQAQAALRRVLVALGGLVDD